jgi:hypothetical protein
VITSRLITVELVYGGPAAPYAIHRHEQLDPKGKYLEKPLMEAVGTLARDLSDDLNLERV